MLTRKGLDTLGLVEVKTIAAGARLLDLLLKAAEVELYKAGPICSGRFLIRIGGAQSSVEAALAAVASDASLLDWFVLPRIAPELLQALQNRQFPEPGFSLGVVESRRAASGIAAADKALKGADVMLARLAVAQGINGKSFMVFSGTLAQVDEAVALAAQTLGNQLVDQSVIARPEEITVASLVGMQPSGPPLL
nr:BMC domain-containing protein [Desulfobulbus rhabdoformis]